MFETAPLRWKKRGLIVRPNKKLAWAQTHCMVPTPQMLQGGLVRIYFSGRDAANRSSIGFAIVDLNADGKVLEFSDRPILTPGELGCFDDNGVTPSCVRESGGRLFLYYLGWNPGSTVRMHLFGGLAISEDDGRSFQRWSRAPILERCRCDPFLNTAPWVVEADGEFRVYYVSGCGWIHKDLPRYNIKMGRSTDGMIWQRDGHISIDFRDDAESALARPYVIFEDGVWKMWFAHKGEAYRLGYAESADGITWQRRDDLVGLDRGPSGFDSEMIEYAAVVKHNGRHFMFYNGNNYGYDGIGLAVEE
jgi:predicted GH43/DUF377 family glycosyl hydrolase